jgi:hypothetical protein
MPVFLYQIGKSGNAHISTSLTISELFMFIVKMGKFFKFSTRDVENSHTQLIINVRG